MTMRYRDLRGALTTSPPLAALMGGQLAKADRIRSVHAQLDSVLANDRGVVARVGLHGAQVFQVTSVDPVSMTQEYPLRSTYRTVARVPAFTLLPGHFLRLSAIVVPCGMTNKLGGPLWTTDTVYGEISASVAWDGPSMDSTVHKVVLPVSPETWGAEATDAGAAWANLKRVEIPIMFPDKVTTALADLHTWSESTTAEVTIQYRGGVRCVDLVLQQIPLAYARDIGTDTLYSSSMVSDGQGKPIKTYPVQYPVEERTSTDPTFGSALALDIAHRQHALGPVLAHWTAWDESAAVTATEIPVLTIYATTFEDILDTSISAWSAANPGWSLSAGAYAQQFKTSNARREMRGNNGCVPVRCWVYGSRVSGAAADAYVRFQTSAVSVVDVPIGSGTPGWFSATGYLRCGAHPQDPSVLQVLGRATSGGADSLSVSCILVEFVDL